MQATPATWSMLLDSGWEGNRDMKILCGGELLPAHLSKRILPACGQLWNMYGPTETTVWSTCCRVENSADTHVGSPIANTETLILDAGGHLVTARVPGELFIGGNGLARGYRGRPDLTERSFIRHPFKKGEKVYRTGDQAAYRKDGNIDYLGRIDDQVKVRGFRIELGEIEHALRSCKSVNDCTVAIINRESSFPEIIAYIVTCSDESFSPNELRKVINKQLPDYMMPQAFVKIDKLPVSLNGKIDKRALPVPQSTQIQSENYLAPLGEIEIGLAKFWTDLLKIDQVSRTDNFFNIGGHSLLALRMIEKVHSQYSVRLTPRSVILEDLSELARIISENNSCIEQGKSSSRPNLLSRLFGKV